MGNLFEMVDAKCKKNFFKILMIGTILLSLFILVLIIKSIKEYSYIGSGVYPTNTITVSGTGEVFSIPDTGSFSFSVNEEGKTVKDAQEKASKKMNAILDSLKDMGIEDKDIKTTGYNSGPKYEWRQGACTTPTDLSRSDYYCPPGKSVLVGYEVNQSISVKVRKTDEAGDVLTKVGELGATNISNLDFVVDDLDAVKAEARAKAITNAKEKAKTLSKSLDIKLVKIVSFNDSSDYPSVYYGVSSAMEAKGMGSDMVATPAPRVPTGENKIVSNVSITYEVK